MPAVTPFTFVVDYSSILAGHHFLSNRLSANGNVEWLVPNHGVK
jgi:hypothetical protein